MKREHTFGGWRLLVAIWPLFGFGGCIGSNVLAHEQRLVAPVVAELQFAPAPALPLAGLYESVLITGEVALALRKVYYVFQGDGTRTATLTCDDTAAALVESDGQSAFQTLSGTWRSLDAGLELDGKEPVPLEQAPGHVRITAPNGSLVLRAETLR